MQSGKADTWSYGSPGEAAASKPRSPGTKSTQGSTSTSSKSVPYVNPADYYGLLGLSEKRHLATLDEIRSAFRRELMKYHPDRADAEGFDHEQASTRTRELYDAFAVLRDPTKRAAYDKKGFF